MSADAIDDVLVSPTEPAAVRALGRTSGEPECRGADLLWSSPLGAVGVQRKELGDLVASLRDGRLALEIGRLTTLAVAVLLVEGRVRWSSAGRLVTGGRPGMTRAQLRALLWTVQRRGVWITTARDLPDTVEVLRHLHGWLGTRRHTALERRPKPRSPDDRNAVGVHLLEALPSVGPVLANSIVSHFGGVPVKWSCDLEELVAVPGVGPVRAARLAAALGAPPGGAHHGDGIGERVDERLPFLGPLEWRADGRPDGDEQSRRQCLEPVAPVAAGEVDVDRHREILVVEQADELVDDLGIGQGNGRQHDVDGISVDRVEIDDELARPRQLPESA
jgi:ERCC4-type nuclease